MMVFKFPFQVFEEFREDFGGRCGGEGPGGCEGDDLLEFLQGVEVTA